MDILHQILQAYIKTKQKSNKLFKKQVFQEISFLSQVKLGIFKWAKNSHERQLKEF